MSKIKQFALVCPSSRVTTTTKENQKRIDDMDDPSPLIPVEQYVFT